MYRSTAQLSRNRNAIEASSLSENCIHQAFLCCVSYLHMQAWTHFPSVPLKGRRSFYTFQYKRRDSLLLVKLFIPVSRRPDKVVVRATYSKNRQETSSIYVQCILSPVFTTFILFCFLLVRFLALLFHVWCEIRCPLVSLSRL